MTVSKYFDGYLPLLYRFPFDIAQLVKKRSKYLQRYYEMSMFNSLPIDKILDRTKLKAFADDKLNVAKMIIFLLDRIENIVKKGENAGYQHFLLFQQCFQKTSSSGSLKVGIVWERVKHQI